ncbi:MAG: class I SAM-dependent methyltransferase [Gammaproteobacteria bacterium]|nr:class I SAM-dependent methyltransferase [Gammaproteobacteria bacterium]
MIETLVKMKVPISRLKKPFEYIGKQVVNKNVMNVGAAGGVKSYLPGNEDIWLHNKLIANAKDVYGIDIDEKSIQYAAKYGYVIHKHDCVSMNLEKKFDVIIMSDVIEHVNSPVLAVKNLLKHLSPDGILVITTPNATAGNMMLRAVFRKSFNVLCDHMTIYYPEHFYAICERLGCDMVAVKMLDFTDKSNFATRLKSEVFKLLTKLSPRLASTMLVIIKNKHE